MQNMYIYIGITKTRRARFEKSITIRFVLSILVFFILICKQQPEINYMYLMQSISRKKHARYHWFFARFMEFTLIKCKWDHFERTIQEISSEISSKNKHVQPHCFILLFFLNSKLVYNCSKKLEFSSLFKTLNSSFLKKFKLISI